MKLSQILGVLALVTAIEAQYFSAGWAPGQPAEPSPSSVPEKEAPASKRISPSTIASQFDLSKILTSKPSISLFNRFGINITEKVQNVLEETKNRWDERIPLVTDNNYKDLIVNERLTEEEEKERTWILIM